LLLNQRNLDEALVAVGNNAKNRFSFIEGDICDLSSCREAVKGVEFVLHQAAWDLCRAPLKIGWRVMTST
jgi:UDP-N-acetylglucosamine 4-epimerase